MKKRILAIDQGEHLGGAERFFAELLTRVRDCEIHLVTSKNPEYKKLYKGSGIILHEIELPKFKPLTLGNYLKFKKTQRSVSEIILEVQPTKIVSNTVRTHLLISPLAKKFEIPLIWLAHDRTFPSVFLKWFIRYPDLIVSCSKYVQNFFQQHAYRKNLRFEILYPFGIEKRRLNLLKKKKKSQVIGMVGKFIEWKNQKTFIQLAEDLHPFHPEYNFVLVGSPYQGNKESEEYFKECKNLLKKHNLENFMKIEKNVPELLEEISTWEMLIHCSSDPEPLGRVILEGMAAGCVVLASPFGGPGEIIRHRETGILAKPEREILKRETLSLLEDHEQRIYISNSAQEEIAEKYDWDIVIKKFQEWL